MKIRQDCLRILTSLGVDPSAELDVSVVGPEEMRGLNRTYRGKDSTTDVLSFPMQELGGRPPFKPAPAAMDFMLGDVVVEAERVCQQARQAGHSAAREYRVLIIHGILHLLGYDHEAGSQKKRTMWRRQQELLVELEGSHAS